MPRCQICFAPRETTMTDVGDTPPNVTNMVVAVDDAALSSVVEEQSSSAATTKRNTTSVRQRKTSSSNARSVRFSDHFTLRVPTSHVFYKGESVHVYDLRTSQIQISRLPQFCDSAAAVAAAAAATGQNEAEEDAEEQALEAMHILDDPEEEDHGGSGDFVELQLRDISADRACGLSMLRLTYTVMGIFFTGIVSRCTALSMKVKSQSSINAHITSHLANLSFCRSYLPSAFLSSCSFSWTWW